MVINALPADPSNCTARVRCLPVSWYFSEEVTGAPVANSAVASAIETLSLSASESVCDSQGFSTPAGFAFISAKAFEASWLKEPSSKISPSAIFFLTSASNSACFSGGSPTNNFPKLSIDIEARALSKIPANASSKVKPLNKHWTVFVRRLKSPQYLKAPIVLFQPTLTPTLGPKRNKITLRHMLAITGSSASISSHACIIAAPVMFWRHSLRSAFLVSPKACFCSLMYPALSKLGSSTANNSAFISINWFCNMR